MPTSTWVSPRFPRVKQEFGGATEKIINKNVPQKSLAIKKVLPTPTTKKLENVKYD